jgi:hypothetical protein
MKSKPLENEMTMDARTLEALKASIEKWKRNAKVWSIFNAKIKSKDCPLCRMFVQSTGSCVGCPVNGRTGERLCQDTPYLEAFAYYTLGDVTAFQAAAQKEVAFLESLLPENERNKT